MTKLVAPFPYQGGKMHFAAKIWDRFGNVFTYSEPFAGSLAVLLGNPNGPARNEIVSDSNGFICNFWRAVRAAPQEVARHADYPTFHQDLTARHYWLTEWERTASDKLSADPNWYDAQAAGWWVYGISNWVGKGWCVGKPNNQRPAICASGGMGISAQSASLPGEVGEGKRLLNLMERLSRRLERVVTLNSDWKAAVTPRVLGSDGRDFPVGILLDPPYRTTTGRAGGLYRSDVEGTSEDVAEESFEWAVRNGERYHIAYCCRDGDFALPAGWTSISATFKGVHRKTNGKLDVVMFSPACQERGGAMFPLWS